MNDEINDFKETNITPENNEEASKVVSSPGLKRKPKFSALLLVILVVALAVPGAYLVYNSLAATKQVPGNTATCGTTLPYSCKVGSAENKIPISIEPNSTNYTWQCRGTMNPSTNVARCSLVLPIPTYFTITPTTTPGCSITPSTVERVPAGASHSTEYIGNVTGPGYQFRGFSIDDSPILATGNRYVFSSIIANHTIRAVCASVPITYTIMPVSLSGCSISPSTPQTYPAGASSGPYFGQAQANYIFNGFYIDGSYTPIITNPYVFTNIQNNHSIYAVCTPKPAYTIFSLASPGCIIDPQTMTVVAGTNSREYRGWAKNGFVFYGFRVDGSLTKTTSPYIFTNVQANHTIEAMCFPNNIY